MVAKGTILKPRSISGEWSEGMSVRREKGGYVIRKSRAGDSKDEGAQRLHKFYEKQADRKVKRRILEIVKSDHRRIRSSPKYMAVRGVITDPATRKEYMEYGWLTPDGSFITQFDIERRLFAGLDTLEGMNLLDSFHSLSKQKQAEFTEWFDEYIDEGDWYDIWKEIYPQKGKEANDTVAYEYSKDIQTALDMFMMGESLETVKKFMNKNGFRAKYKGETKENAA